MAFSTNNMQIALFVLLPVVIFFFSLSAYNLYHGGVFVKQRGWRTKEEWPITFWFSVLFPYLCVLFALWGIADPDGLWDFVKHIIGLLGFL